MSQKTWLQHVKDYKNCVACGLCEERYRICLAKGVIPCDILFVGEAPGASEDAIGQPFVGPAGNLLHQIIDRAVDTNVKKAFTNLVACFPRSAKERGDNEPEVKQILACAERLVDFANIAKPRLVVCVGELSAAFVQRWYEGPKVEIVHPAFILARLPQAQKLMAANKCSVQIRTAWFEVVESNSKIVPWVKVDKEKNEQLRIPF